MGAEASQTSRPPVGRLGRVPSIFLSHRTALDHKSNRKAGEPMGLKAVLSCLFLANVCLAQQSSSYKLSEQTFNAGGHPANGVVLASTSFTVRLDAIGGSFAGIGGPGRTAQTAASLRRTRRRVKCSRSSFLDATTLKWRPERSAGVYSLYRDCSQVSRVWGTETANSMT